MVNIKRYLPLYINCFSLFEILYPGVRIRYVKSVKALLHEEHKYLCLLLYLPFLIILSFWQRGHILPEKNLFSLTSFLTSLVNEPNINLSSRKFRTFVVQID